MRNTKSEIQNSKFKLVSETNAARRMQDRRFDATAHGRTDATDAVTDEDGEKIQQQNIVGR